MVFILVHALQKMSFRFRLEQGTFLALSCKMYIWPPLDLSWLYKPIEYISNVLMPFSFPTSPQHLQSLCRIVSPRSERTKNYENILF